MSWLKQNWKVLLAVVAGFVIVILLYLRSRSSSGAGTISFPPNPLSGGGAAADTASTSATPTVSAALKQLSAFHFGWPLKGQKYAWRLTPAGMAWFKRVTGQDWTQGILPGWVDPSSVLPQGIPAYSFEVSTLDPGTNYSDYGLQNDPNAGGDIVGPPQAGGGLGDFGVVPGGRFPFGLGGPGMVYGNLQRASVAAQTASHRASLTNPRRASRLALQARQAAGESRRMFQESRGPAPIGGPGRLLPLAARSRWPR